jgi:serine/threonine-protein kinase
VKKISAHLIVPGLIILMSLFNIILTIVSVDKFSSTAVFIGNFFWIFSGLVFAGVGGLIVSSKPGHTVGRLLLVPAILMTVQFPFEVFFDHQMAQPDVVVTPMLVFFIWLASWTWWFLIGPILLILQLFPTGKVINPRWRWSIYFLFFTIIFFIIALSISPVFVSNDGSFSVTNPAGMLSGENMNFLEPFLLIFIGGNVIVSFTAIFVRFRRAELVHRAQIKWFFFACILFVFYFLLTFVFASLQSGASLMANIMFTIAVLGIPVSIGIAILRHNLWNIDFVINRAVVYGALTATLGGLFASFALLLPNISIGGGNTNVIAGMVAMGAFGLIFQPLRRRVQRFIDHRFYHIEIDYQKTPGTEQFFSGAQSGVRLSEYTNLQLIGRGGMAEVYRATPADGGAPLAIKILPADLADDPNYRKRFDRELMVMRSLDHPNIVQVIDHGQEKDTAYIAMEYIKGVDLAEHLKRVGYLSPEQGLKILAGVCGALDFAHKQGLVHRDIKPPNIMLDEKGDALRPVLMDFGIAKIFGMSMMTGAGFVGTLDYIAPEQIQGQEDIGLQADIYSLGVMTYQMLAGEMPFQKKTPGALLMAHLTQPAPDIREARPDISDGIAEVLMKALRKDPGERFDSAADFLHAIQVA